MTSHGPRSNAAESSALQDAAWQSPVGGIATWLALVAIAVIGRVWQPSWNGEPLWHATPLAAVALAAGFVFPRPLVAASVPLVALGIGNLTRPGYGNLGVAAIVYAATAWPVLLGACGLLGHRRPRWLAVIGGSLASSLVFFISTNLAHWAFTADYPRTGGGLAACFAAALPFYRWMPVGDLCWSLVVFGVLVAAGTAFDAASFRRMRPHPVSTPPLD